MMRKRFMPEQIIHKLREVEVDLAKGRTKLLLSRGSPGGSPTQ